MAWHDYKWYQLHSGIAGPISSRKPGRFILGSQKYLFAINRNSSTKSRPLGLSRMCLFTVDGAPFFLKGV